MTKRLPPRADIEQLRDAYEDLIKKGVSLANAKYFLGYMCTRSKCLGDDITCTDCVFFECHPDDDIWGENLFTIKAILGET